MWQDICTRILATWILNHAMTLVFHCPFFLFLLTCEV